MSEDKASMKGPMAQGEFLGTPTFQWQLLRACADEDGAAALVLNLTGTEAAVDWSEVIKSVSHANGTDGIIDVKSKFGKIANGAQIAFFSGEGTETIENDHFGFDLLAYREGPYGPGLPVYRCAATAAILGDYQCEVHPTLGTAIANGRWVDTITGTDCWPTGVTVNDSGNDRICTLSFDLLGCRYLYLHVHSATGAAGGGEAGDIGAVITAW